MDYDIKLTLVEDAFRMLNIRYARKYDQDVFNETRWCNAEVHLIPQ